MGREAVARQQSQAEAISDLQMRHSQLAHQFAAADVLLRAAHDKMATRLALVDVEIRAVEREHTRLLAEWRDYQAQTCTFGRRLRWLFTGR